MSLSDRKGHLDAGAYTDCELQLFEFRTLLAEHHQASPVAERPSGSVFVAFVEC